MGWVILDRDDPGVILERSAAPLLSSSTPWQRGTHPWRCNVANVVFCEAAAHVPGERDVFRLWFGGADAHVGTVLVRVRARRQRHARAGDGAAATAIAAGAARTQTRRP